MALELSYEGTGVIPINTVLIGPLDADGFRGMSLQVHSCGAGGSVVVQQSHDGEDWDDSIISSIAGPQATNATQGTRWLNLVGRYVRVIMNPATTSGDTSLDVRLHDDEFSELGTGMTNMVITSLPALPYGANRVGMFACDLSSQASNGPVFNVHRLVQSAATKNATLVKAGPGRIARIWGRNNVASLRHLKLYNKAFQPDVGVDVPYISLTLPANSEFSFDLQDFGLHFSAGIGYGMTTGIADTDSTAIGAADILGLHIVYI